MNANWQAQKSKICQESQGEEKNKDKKALPDSEKSGVAANA